MNLQSAFYRFKDLIPLPRVLAGVTWLSIGLLCANIGVFTAGIVETRFLTVPFQSADYTPTAQKKADKPMSIDEFEPIITYNVFNAEISEPELTEESEPGPTKPGINLEQILSQLQLVGISVLQGEYAVCVIKYKKDNQEDIFAVNDPLFDTDAVVKKIVTNQKEDKVYIQLGDEVGALTFKEDLSDSKKPSVTAKQRPQPKRRSSPAAVRSEYTTDGKNFHISSTEVDAQLNDFAKLLNQARMVPYFRNGKHRGYQVKAIDKGSLYEKLGLKNHDIIQEINGEPLDSMEKVMSLFKKFRNEREFTIKLNRRGTARYLNYYID